MKFIWARVDRKFLQENNMKEETRKEDINSPLNKISKMGINSKSNAINFNTHA